MPLASGTRLGPYEIQGPLGAGGMGEVYRARDTRLDRAVAVKVLPQHLAATPELKARFEREARTVSALNHPNICTLHDIGSENGVDYLVMELVEGETLAERLGRGPLPAAEVLRIGVQIADALDRAHRSGVVHRDLKPGNVMLTRAGAKLLDFGLARVTGMAGPAGASGVTVAALSQSPTVAQPLTAEGTLVGTFQYMSPEQLEGKEADERSDLWALGAVLYEMATGRRAFEGRSQASLIAAILEKEPPPIAEVAPLSPPGLDRLVRACLAKDPEERIQTAHDARLQLQWIGEGGSQAGVPAPVAARRRQREGLAWGVAAVAVAGLAVIGGSALLLRPEPAAVTRFEVRAPGDASTVSWPRLSPDGRTLAFLAADTTGKHKIWLRPLDAIQSHSLLEIETSARPFWSPDGRHLAFFSGGKLRKVPVAGGPMVAIADVAGGVDGSWGSRDFILFDGSQSDSIRVVSASGGAAKPVTRIDRARGESGHAWPSFLPDGHRFLFVAYTTATTTTGTIRLGRLGSFETRELGRTDGRVEYAPPGYLVFVSGGTLVAQPFDARAGRTTGDPVPVGENVTVNLTGNGDFTVSPKGALAYRSEGASAGSRLVWMDRQGRVLGEAAPPGRYQDVTLSPDDSRVALSIPGEDSKPHDIWVRDLARGSMSRITFDPDEDIWPVWSPDGSRIAYCNRRRGNFGVYTRAANGVGADDSLAFRPGGEEGPTSWSAAAIVTARFQTGNWNLWVMNRGPDPDHRALIETPFSERDGQLSPDGRWLAYASNESGRFEVYVVPFSGTQGKWQVSIDGGRFPRWRADGRQLFFQSLQLGMMAATVTPGASFDSGVPARLFRMTLAEGAFSGYRWDVTRDGQRFLINTPVGDRDAGRLIVATDWTAELGRRR